MKTIQKLEKDKCCGCSACLNICPIGAISMQQNKEGFLYPKIDESKCTKCGLCAKHCPVICPPTEITSVSPDCYAFMASDEVRMNKCSSGGAFPVLGEHFIKNGGFVAGAAFNNGTKVEHLITNNLNDFERLKGSKYLQSNIKNCYKEIKELLNDKKEVLFSGTPCQIAGLRTYLGKEYENLFCVDIICHGVPSQKLFDKYIDEIKSDNESFVNTNFRDKVKGWQPHLTTTTTTTTTTTYKFGSNDDLYLRAFLSNLCLRKNCSTCPFNKLPRVSDMTIGDFWRIGKFDKTLNDEKGTSVILVNSSKGEKLLKILSEQAKILKQMPLKNAIYGNQNIVRPTTQIHPNRNKFYELIENKSFNEALEFCLEDKCDYVIVNLWYSLNYGAAVTAWAIQTLLNDMGLTCKLLNRHKYWSDDKDYKGSFSQQFADKFLTITNKYSDYTLRNLSNNIKGIIIGSDQVLRPDYIKDELHKFMLNWADKDTRKIALSASFGIDRDEFAQNNYFKKEKVAKTMQQALASFDYLSCREISGKEVFKDIFGLDSDFILDPVFLIDKDKYNEIIQHSKLPAGNEIVSYVLDDNKEYQNAYKYLEEIFSMKVDQINGKNLLVEDWLNKIKNCKLLITDSFHGVCFAIIFNRPFICIKNTERGSARFDSLDKLFNIKNNILKSVSEIYTKEISLEQDYSTINTTIKNEVERSLELVKKVLIDDYSNNPNAKENFERNKKFLAKQKYSFETYGKKVKLFRYQILSNITSGKKKEHYKLKKNLLREELKSLK